MDARLRSHLEAAARLALRAQDWRTLDGVTTLLRAASGTAKPKTSAERVAEFRARRRNESSVTSGNESNVTSVTPVGPLSSDSSPSKQDSEILDFSSLSQTSGSLKQGSDLEEGARGGSDVTLFSDEKASKVTRKRNENASRCVTSDATPDEVSAWCLRWGVPHPDTDPEAAHWLEHHRAKGSRMVDWKACWGTWRRNTVKFAAARQANGKHVQPHDPTAEWAKDGHGGWR